MYDEIFSQITNAANKRNLRDSTIYAYCTSVAHFLKYTDKSIDALTTDDVDTFLTEKRLSGISPETYNHYHSGIRFFYKKVLKMNWDDDDIPRMKRDRNLPTVLTKAEKSHTFTMMTFHAPIKQYTSVMAKAALTVIPCLLTVHLRYLQNTGLNATDQQGFCFQVHGLAIIL